MSFNRYRYEYQSSSYYRPSLLGGFRFFPPVIKYLLIINALTFLIVVFLGNFRFGESYFGYTLTVIFALLPLGDGFYPWQLLTYMFMHGGFGHLLMNMFVLWMFGMELENVWGSKRFLTYYLLCGIGAGVANLLVAPLFTTAAPTVGASGAIYGVLLAFGLMFPDRPIFVYFLLPVKAKYFVSAYILLELFYGVTGTSDGVAHFAHLGGAAVGFILLNVDWDRFPLFTWWDNMKASLWSKNQYGVRYRKRHDEVTEAKFFDIRDAEKKKDEEEISQERIDEILDKISKGGYQSLTEEEKRILFEASKKMN